MTRPRDNQRQRLYDAERAISIPQSKAATKHLVEGQKVDSTGSVHIEACQAYADHVTTAAWFQSRWGRRQMKIRHKVYGRATNSRGTNVISVPPWARQEWVLLHEMAHALTPDHYADHGPEFAGVLLTLTRYQQGAEAAKMLRESFKTHRVRYNLNAVPKAGTRPVTPRTAIESKQRVARKQEQAAADWFRIRDHAGVEGRRRTARSLRALIETGYFGPAGSADRKAALRLARVLEKDTGDRASLRVQMDAARAKAGR